MEWRAVPLSNKQKPPAKAEGFNFNSMFVSSYKQNVHGFVGRGRLLLNGLPLIFVLRGSICAGRRISSAVRPSLGKFGV